VAQICNRNIRNSHLCGHYATKGLPGSRLGLNGALFFLTNKNTRSSLAFECGMVKASCATWERKGKLPSTLVLVARCAQIKSIE